MVFTTAFSQLRSSRLEAVILQSGERRVITDNARGGRYLSTGHLAFTRGDAVLAARVMGRVGRAGAFTPFGLAAGPNRRPRVSPDGQRVAFESPRSGGDAAFEGAVHVHDLRRGTVTRLTGAGAESQPVWRPDGSAIAVYARARMYQAYTSRTSAGRSTSSFGTMMLGPPSILNHFRPTARCSPSRANRAVGTVSGC